MADRQDDINNALSAGNASEMARVSKVVAQAARNLQPIGSRLAEFFRPGSIVPQTCSPSEPDRGTVSEEFVWERRPIRGNQASDDGTNNCEQCSNLGTVSLSPVTTQQPWSRHIRTDKCRGTSLDSRHPDRGNCSRDVLPRVDGGNHFRIARQRGGVRQQ